MARDNLKNMSEGAKKVFGGVIFDLYQWEQVLYDGSKATFEKLMRDDTVVVLPVTCEGKIVLLDQEQPDLPRFLGFPGGRIDEGEDDLGAAKRELLEETGFAGDSWELWFDYCPTPKIDWKVSVYIARNCRKVAEQKGDGGEKFYGLKEVDFEEFFEFATSDKAEFPMASKLLKIKLDGKLGEFKDRLCRSVAGS